MTVAVRFAPSPTGRLHVGNVRLALVNWLLARARGGSFMLRLDDTDAERSTEEFARGIERDLLWLGLGWDRFARQGGRLGRYAEAVEALRAAGRVYPAYETPDELERARKARLERGRPPVYDRAALRLSDEDRRRLESEGRRPHWRFRLDDRPVAWDDLVRGAQRFRGGDLSDPVVVREDGRPLYTLCSVVDDLDFGITHVVRGEDHVANTAVQIQIFEALGGPEGRGVPAFAHLPLLTDAAGQGLSKRLGSLGIEALREEGIEPMALASLLAKLGTSDPIEPRSTLDELAREFDLAKVSRATPKFDSDELTRLNARLLHAMPFETARPRLDALGLAGADAAFWEAVRPNIARLDEARDWWQIAREPIDPVVEDPAFTAAAAALLPPEPWDEGTWGAWVEAVRQATGRKGKALFLPLRLALTGREHGPELRVLLPLLRHGRASERLAGRRA